MKLKKIELKKLEIPFRVSFKHASAQRTKTETIIALAYSESGVIVYGEGCPRSYVTGESIKSCMDFIANHHHDIVKVDGIDSLKRFISANQPAIDKNPAAWCAIETAILDLLGKLENKSIEAVLGIPEIQGSFHYTAVLGISNPKVFAAQLAQYIQIGFNDFKVKISGDASIDKANIKAISTTLPSAKIRLDANNLWNNADEAITYLSSIAKYFWAVEEPIKISDYVGLKTLAEHLGCKIILDESFLKIADLDHLSGDSNIWIPNIRISKMGGLLRSLDIAEECRKRGIKFIIGAQVGETSILTRVAISLANAYRDILIAQEGAYGTHLLEHDINDSPIMFGKKGMVNLGENNIKGLGLNWTF
ncbi:MAG: enolase C-terminal domain-like protein [Alphaproteobacteria bacterium]|jgi:L-alanine-DL-glutamate epimerase-like enolase superfamily enzyme